MEIIYKSNSTMDFATRVKETITYLDTAIFEKPARVSINTDVRYANFGTGGFMSKRLLFRLLGLSDDYVIFERSKKMEIIMKMDFMATCLAAHEVRHRFQHYNKKTLITFDFLQKNKILTEPALAHIQKGNYDLYGKDKEMYGREFDASAIETIISGCSKAKNFTMNDVIDLIKCNESTISQIVSGIAKRR